MLNYKILYILSIILLNGSLLAQDDITKINFPVNSDSDENLISYALTKDQQIEDPIILLDSNVTAFDQNIISINKELTKLGENFMYEINTNKLKEISSLDDNKSLMKLAKYQDSDFYLISDGTFIIAFKNQINVNEFAEEYNIILLRAFDNIKRASFKFNDFEKLQNKIKNIRSDPRILYVRYDLINPKPAFR